MVSAFRFAETKLQTLDAPLAERGCFPVSSAHLAEIDRKKNSQPGWRETDWSGRVQHREKFYYCCLVVVCLLFAFTILLHGNFFMPVLSHLPASLTLLWWQRHTFVQKKADDTFEGWGRHPYMAHRKHPQLFRPLFWKLFWELHCCMVNNIHCSLTELISIICF